MKTSTTVGSCSHSLDDVTTPIDLDDLPLFEQAAAPFKKALNDAARVHKFSRGHVLFMQDDVADWFYLVQKGWFKLYRQTLDGEEVIMDILPAGALMGETSIFEKGIYTCGAEVIQDTQVTAYPVALLREHLHNTPSFALAMLHHIANNNKKQQKEIEHRTIQNAPQRLSCYLLRLIHTHKPAPLTLHLPYDKTLIAARLGMKAETFSRSLVRLKEDLNITVHGATLNIPSVDELVRYSCSACSNVFPCGEGNRI